MSCDVGEVTERLENEQSSQLQSQQRSFSNPSFASPMSQALHLIHLALPTSQLILQPLRCFSYVTVHSSTLPSLYLRHKLSLNSPRFTYFTAHSPTLPLLQTRHSSFSNPSFASPTSQALHLIHLALPTSQLILQPFRCSTYVTVHSPILLSLLLHHKLFT